MGGGVVWGGVGWANNVIGTSCYTILFVLLDFHAYVILRYCMCLFDDDDDGGGGGDDGRDDDDDDDDDDDGNDEMMMFLMKPKFCFLFPLFDVPLENLWKMTAIANLSDARHHVFS